MNFFTEHSTAQDALNFYWQCKDDLAAIDMLRVLEVANEGEQPATLQPTGDLNEWFTGDNDEGAVIPATLQPDTPYPVPTIVERTIARQRHNSFMPENEPTIWELGDNPDYDDGNDDYLIGDSNEHPSVTD